MNLVYQEDLPAVEPAFDYRLIAKSLTPLLLQKSRNATVLGIHGPWGSGKTTLMVALRRELESQLPQDQRAFIDFNAWKFQDRAALWRALILHILGELKRHGADMNKVEELEQALYRAFVVEEKGPWRLNWRTLIVEVIGILFQAVKLDFVAKALRGSTGFLGRLFLSEKKADDDEQEPEPLIDKERVEKLASVLERTTVERSVIQVQSIEQFLTEFRTLMDELAKNDRHVFIFIDDLDRCLPESALEIFEAIKLFLDAPNCCYVVALDRDVIRKGLAVKYAAGGKAAQGQVFIDPDEYIEKTISVSYDLARLSPKDVGEFIDSYRFPIELNNRHRELIVAGLGTNPRRVKRFMNTLAVQLNLAQAAKAAGLPVPDSLVSNERPQDLEVFLKLLMIAYRYSGLFAMSLVDPGLLVRLQRIGNAYRDGRGRDLAAARVERNNSLSGEAPLVGNLREEEEFWRMMGLAPNLIENNELVPLARRLQNWFRNRP